jgi:hypothetical protein
MPSLFAHSFHRRMLSLLVLGPVLGAAAGARAETPSLRFEGTNYVLVSVDGGEANVVKNLYVPVGQTAETAETMIGIRQWPRLKRPTDASKAWEATVDSRLLRPKRIFTDNSPGNGNSFMVEIWLRGRDADHNEVQLWRFLSEKGSLGVKAYYYTQQVPKDDDSAYTARHGSHLRQLADLKSPIQFK